MKQIRMKPMRASVFDLGEAERRLDPSDVPEERKRGRHDTKDMVVTTAAFSSFLSAKVPVNGSIEFGIPRKTLAELVAGKPRKAVSKPGPFVVNGEPVHGTLHVDFGKQEATFEYWDS